MTVPLLMNDEAKEHQETGMVARGRQMSNRGNEVRRRRRRQY